MRRTAAGRTAAVRVLGLNAVDWTVLLTGFALATVLLLSV
jgi:hypothetical protein